jgi:tRNA(His) guanylyltransferase
MKNTDRTSLGDRIKSYEAVSTSRRAFKGQPLIARLDGKSFHAYCRGMKRPFDGRLSSLMIKLMAELVDRFGATVGYTQSDEITLVWLSETDSISELVFGGRHQKLDSLLAGYSSSFFALEASRVFPEKEHLIPHFDCRSFVVPNVQEAYHCVLWRQQDATKNAISMAAQSVFSHKELQNKNSATMIGMLQGRGIEFDEYPEFFKRGTFAHRVKEERVLSEAELLKIPELHRPTGPVLRSFIDISDIALNVAGVEALLNNASGT